MHSFVKRVTVWGLSGIMALGLIAFPNPVHRVGAQASSGAAFQAETVTFIEPSDTWNYFAQGVDPEQGWNLAGFDDSAWSSGAAPLGYGDVGETTVVGFGPNPNSKYVSTYFRKTFTVTDPAQLESASLELTHSDGAIIYLNGNFVANPHLRPDGVNSSTRPLACDNKEQKTYPVDPSLFVAGENVLAVELHVCEANTGYLFLQAALTGRLNASLASPTATLTTQPTLRPTPVPTTEPPTGGDVMLVAKGQSWRYYDQGEISTPNWTWIDFADTRWKTGQAPFGYGGAGEKTAVGFGPNPAQKYTTTYFRKEFSVVKPNHIEALILDVVADDGAVAYLNGEKIGSANLPESGVTFDTVPETCGNQIITRLKVDPALLKPGKNVLALEQHQCYPDALNMFVDASLGALLTIGRAKPADFPSKLSAAALAAGPTHVPPTSTPEPDDGLPPAPGGQQWSLRWSDDFNGTQVDPTKWRVNNLTRSEDPNKTWYHPNNVEVSSGTLKLHVKKESHNGANFTGGMLESTGNYRRNRYGYYEARIKYDLVGPGFWTNFWMCGVDRWPPEFDNEVITHRDSEIFLGNHFRDSNGRHSSVSTYYPVDFNDWHTYGILWLPDQPVRFYVDGELAYTVTGEYENPPSIDMYISLRAGAYYDHKWGGLPDETTRYPGIAEYDYIRVYEAVD